MVIRFIKKEIKNSSREGREEGSALASVLMIATIIVLFIGGIFSVIVMQGRFIQRDIHKTQSMYAAEQHLFEYLYSKRDSLLSESDRNANYEHVRFANHGLLGLVQSSGFVGNQESHIQVLIGTQADPYLDFAIALGDTNSALTLTGSPSISGDIQTGQRGVQFDNFRGSPYQGTFDGKNTQPTDVYDDFQDFGSILDSLISSFEDKVRSNENSVNRFLFEDDADSDDLNAIPPDMTEIIVKGNLAIDKPLSVSDYLQILVSDSVFITEKMEGSHLIIYSGEYLELSEKAEVQGQFFTPGNAVVSGQSYLRYPSVLGVYFKQAGFEPKTPLQLTGDSIIDGLLLTVHENVSSASGSDFKNIVEDNALIRGAFFNTGLSEITGSVFGTVITDSFEFYESPTSYVNWIREGEIDVFQRPDRLSLPYNFGSIQEYEIIDYRIIDEAP